MLELEQLGGLKKVGSFVDFHPVLEVNEFQRHQEVHYMAWVWKLYMYICPSEQITS